MEPQQGRGAGDDDQGRQGGRETARDAPEKQDQQDGAPGDQQAPDVELAEIVDHMVHLGEEALRLGGGQAQRGLELPRGDEQGRAGGKGHHDRMGDEVGQFAQTGKAHAHLDEAAEQGDAEDVGHAGLLGQAGHGDAADADRAHGGEQHHGDGVGGPGGQVAGRAPEGGHDDRQHAGIDAVLRMHAGDEGIGHGLGDGHGGDGERGHEVGAEVAQAVVAQFVQEGEDPGGIHGGAPAVVEVTGPAGQGPS